MTKGSPNETCSIQYSRRMSRGRNIQGVAHLQNQNYLCKGSLKYSTCSELFASSHWPITGINTTELSRVTYLTPSQFTDFDAAVVLHVDCLCTMSNFDTCSIHCFNNAFAIVSMHRAPWKNSVTERFTLYKYIWKKNHYMIDKVLPNLNCWQLCHCIQILVSLIISYC